MKIKTLYILLLACLTSVTLNSCDQNDYLQYDENQAYVGFAYPSYGNDSIVYSFALHPNVEEDIVKVPMKLFGYAASQDREVANRQPKKVLTLSLSRSEWKPMHIRIV